MARQLTPAAQAAKEIRKYLKEKGIPARVKSSNFSMGSSVDVHIHDQRPEVVKQIEIDIDKYEYGTFDAMTDCSGIKNRDFDGPQAKYVTVTNDFTDTLKQEAWEYIRGYWSGADELPETYKDVPGHTQLFNEYVPTFVYQHLTGYRGEFWESKQEEPTPEPEKVVKPVNGARIEEHTHTKKGFQMYIVVLSSRVERDEYLRLYDIAKDNGGWYTRKWSTTPAGFAFRQREQAEKFLSFTAGEDNDTEEQNEPIEPQLAGVRLPQQVAPKR